MVRPTPQDDRARWWLRSLLLPALLLPAPFLGGCLSSVTNGYLYSCANGESCPSGSGCGGDGVCHPVYVADAGPSDAGSYLCASSSPQCPAAQVCGSDQVCGAVDGGTSGSDGGSDGGSTGCDLASAFPGVDSYACGSDCAGLAIADFNRDGYPDVVVNVDPDANGRGGLALLLNAQDGTLGPPLTTRAFFPCGGAIPDETDFSVPDALAVGDFNGDGWPDLGLSISQSNQLALALNGQDSGFVVGGFQPQVSPGCDSSSFSYSQIAAFQPQAGQDWYLASVGFGIEDADDNSVLAVSHVQSNGQGLDPWVSLEPAADNVPSGFALGQFGGAQLLGAALAETSGAVLGQVEVFPGTSSGGGGNFSSTASSTLACQQGTNAVATADLDGDGLLDLVAVNSTSNSVTVFYAKSGGFKSGASFSTILGDAGFSPATCVIADLDGDGRPDIATVNFSGSVTILKGLSDGGFVAVATPATAAPSAYWIGAVDLEDHGAGDGGLPDLVISYLSNADGSTVDVLHNACR